MHSTHNCAISISTSSALCINYDDFVMNKGCQFFHGTVQVTVPSPTLIICVTMKMRIASHEVRFTIIMANCRIKDSLVEHGSLVLCPLESRLGSQGSVLSWIIMLCSWAVHSTVTVLLFTQEYK